MHVRVGRKGRGGQVSFAAKQLSADPDSLASVSECQGCSENSAKVLQTLFWAKMLRFGCRLQLQETDCETWLLVASGWD